MRVQETRLAKAAAESAAADPALVGIDPISILTFVSGLFAMLQSIFAKCSPSPPTPVTTQEHVQAAYHDGDGEYDQSVFGPAVVEAKKQLRRDKHVHNLGRDGRAQAKALAAHGLDAIRNGSDDEVSECFSACQFGA